MERELSPEITNCLVLPSGDVPLFGLVAGFGAMDRSLIGALSNAPSPQAFLDQVPCERLLAWAVRSAHSPFSIRWFKTEPTYLFLPAGRSSANTS